MKSKRLMPHYDHCLVLNKSKKIVYFNDTFYRSFLSLFRKKLVVNSLFEDFIPQNYAINLQEYFTEGIKKLDVPEKNLHLEVRCHRVLAGNNMVLFIFEIRNLNSPKIGNAPDEALHKYSFLTSHVLRAPLSTILSLTDVFSNPELEFYNFLEIKGLLNSIQKQAEKLDEIIFTINGLLNDDGYNEHFTNEPLSKSITSIVLVDDDLLTNKIHQRLISQYCPDIALVSFSCAKLALEHINRSPPDLVLLDINMPEINGWEFLKYMETRNIPSDVAIISSSIDVKDKRSAKQFKAVKLFLEKPLNYNKIQFLLNSRFSDVSTKA